jgi:hypothetical protein
MKDVAPHDRPREKLERLGVQGLGDVCSSAPAACTV